MARPKHSTFRVKRSIILITLPFFMGILFTQVTNSFFSAQNDCINDDAVLFGETSVREIPVTYAPQLLQIHERIEGRDPNTAKKNVRIIPKRPLHDEKYYQEFRRHLDFRYAVRNTGASNDEVNPIGNQKYKELIFPAFHEFMNKKKLTFWLAHGTLLGWYWNEKALPFDDDIDVQVTFDTLMRMHSYNKSIYWGRYVLDVNPNSIYPGWQPNNIIDARFIDMFSGWFIDITAVSYGPDGTLLTKDPAHSYNFTDIFPLKQTHFEGKEVWRPNQASFILYQEYGWKGLTDIHYNNNTFDSELKLWLPDKKDN